MRNTCEFKALCPYSKDEALKNQCTSRPAGQSIEEAINECATKLSAAIFKTPSKRELLKYGQNLTADQIGVLTLSGWRTRKLGVWEPEDQ